MSPFFRYHSTCTLLLLSLGALRPGFARTTVPRIEVYDFAELEPHSLRELASTIQQILAISGIPVEAKICLGSVRASCECQEGRSDSLMVRIVPGRAPRDKDDEFRALGESYAGCRGGRYATVFVGPVKDEAASAGVSWQTVLAYAAVHEIGHLMLGARAHSLGGLMKPVWRREEYHAMMQYRLRFTRAQRDQMADRYGVPGQSFLSSTSRK